MQFSEKLDFLMNITKTKNSALSQNINLDASHISRLRRGQRNPLKDQSCLRSMAAYFSRRSTEAYQLKALSDALNTAHLTYDDEKNTELIAQWLMNDIKHESKTVELFLTGLSSMSAKQKMPVAYSPPSVEFPREDISTYYGAAGKRQAAIYFLSEVIAQTKPLTLLLYSDEATDWMTEDRAFMASWASLMVQVLSKGHRIKIIHTVSRDLDEMFNAISQWMPLYMSGAIEPYYYPKKRDGIFKRTLFVAPGISAVVSGSVGTMADQAANQLFRNSDIINTFALEFNQYLEQCKPLMRIFTEKDYSTYVEALLEFEAEKSDTIIKTESLSLLTMPDTVVASITSRIGEQGGYLMEYRKKRMNCFEENIQDNAFTEIIKIYDPESVKANNVTAGLSVLLDGSSICYTAAEYIAHLENILLLMQTYSNFNVCLVEAETENRYTAYIKEDVGVFISKTSMPPVALAINESNMTAAFLDYLRLIIGEKALCNTDNKESTGELAEYIKRLKQAII